jgi:hypothetical protein
MVENLDTFTLVCLDFNTDPREEDRRQLLSSYFKIFHNLSDCRSYIEENQNKNIILIAASYLGRIIMPSIHPLSQLTAVYIYCDNKRETEEWTKCYPKVSMNKSSLPFKCGFA